MFADGQAVVWIIGYVHQACSFTIEARFGNQPMMFNEINILHDANLTPQSTRSPMNTLKLVELRSAGMEVRQLNLMSGWPQYCRLYVWIFIPADWWDKHEKRTKGKRKHEKGHIHTCSHARTYTQIYKKKRKFQNKHDTVTYTSTQRHTHYVMCISIRISALNLIWIVYISTVIQLYDGDQLIRPYSSVLWCMVTRYLRQKLP